MSSVLGGTARREQPQCAPYALHPACSRDFSHYSLKCCAALEAVRPLVFSQLYSRGNIERGGLLYRKHTCHVDRGIPIRVTRTTQVFESLISLSPGSLFVVQQNWKEVKKKIGVCFSLMYANVDSTNNTLE